MNILALALRALPLVVSLALRFGAGGVAADAIRSGVKRVRLLLDKTPNRVDNLLVEPLLRLALNLAGEIEAGRLGGKDATERVRVVVDLLLAALAKRD